MPRTTTLTNARRKYVVAELTDLGINTQDDLGTLLAEEMLFALYPPVHEGKAPTYGAIITRGSDFEAYHESRLFGIIRRFDFGTLDTNRAAADGLSTFLWRAPASSHAQGIAIVISFESARFSDELLAFSLRDDALHFRHPHDRINDDFYVVQRTSKSLRILAQNHVVYVRGNHWTTHPYQYDFQLDEVIRRGWKDQDLAEIGRSVSRLAMHLLSPNGIGTTFVLLAEPLDDDNPVLALGNAVSLDTASAGERLSLRTRGCHRAIASIVSQLDGAVLISPEGTATHANVWLNLPPDARDASLGGARQRSAQEASRSLNGIVVTVSADGPVRAYIDGGLCLTTVNDEEKLVVADPATSK
jgi:hypothetical protein